LQATITEDEGAVRLTWEDRSDNEDAFRLYRQDMEASIGLAPADAESFLDETVSCGNTYRYGVVAFNAAGTSSISGTVEVILPPCALADEPPTIELTLVPTQVLAGELVTISFEASDDLAMVQVVLRGEETGDPVLDAGQAFTCTGLICTASWPVTVTGEVSSTLTLTAVALDSTGQESGPVEAALFILPAEALPSPQETPGKP
jgi:hypothetical protein